MTTQNKIDIVDLYRSLLSSAGMVAGDEGHISTQIAGSDKHPTLVKGKRLVLPTPEQLAGANSTTSVIFHPLRENILRPHESDVMTVFRKHITKRLNFSLGFLAFSLLTLSVETDKHPKLTPDQSPFLSIVKNADEKTLTIFEEILSKMAVGDEENSFVHIYLKKGGVFGNTKYSKVCNVSFPIYDELLKEPEKGKGTVIFGVKLRKIDRETLLGLFKFILPEIGKAQAYWSGSLSELAPSMDALIKTVVVLGTRINEVASLFANYIDDVDSITYDLDYVPIFNDLDSIRTQINSIPMQLGNEGNIPAIPQGSGAPAIAVSQQVVNQSPYATGSIVQPTQQPAQHVGSKIESSPFLSRTPDSGDPVDSLNQVVATAAAYQPPPPWQAPPPVYAAPAPVYTPPVPAFIPNPAYRPDQGMPGYPAPQYPQQVYPAPTPQPLPGLVKTSGGIDVNSIFQSNPALAAQVAAQLGVQMGYVGYGSAQPMQQQQRREPSWSKPAYQNPSQGGYGSGI